MQKPLINYAFIDSQNVNLGIREPGWILDWVKFRVYLREKYGVKIAYAFVGYIEENQDLYKFLQKSGYVLVFKEVLKGKMVLLKEIVMPNWSSKLWLIMTNMKKL